MYSIFDDDYSVIRTLMRKYLLIVLVLLGVLMLLLFKVSKERYYENMIEFTSDKKACLLVTKDVLKSVRQNQKIIISNNDYDYNIEKIEENGENYLVHISFDISLKLDSQTYKIILGKENMISYIIRIIQSEL